MLVEVEVLGPAQAGGALLFAGASGGACDRDVRLGRAVLTPGACDVANGIAAQADGLLDGCPGLNQLDGEGRIATGRAHRNDLAEGRGGGWQVPAKRIPARACLVFLDGTEEGDREMQVVGMEASKPVRWDGDQSVEPTV